MGVEIRLADRLTDEEREQLFGWGEDIFGAEHLGLKWKPKDWHFIVEEGGRAVGHVGVLRHEVEVGGVTVAVGGVGGVVTVPEVRGRGYAQLAMRRAESFMRDELKASFGLLFCRDQLVPFYERQGWRTLADPVEFEQPSGRTLSPLVVMVLPLGDRAWPAGATDLKGLPW